MKERSRLELPPNPSRSGQFAGVELARVWEQVRGVTEISEAMETERRGVSPAETQTCADLVVGALRELAGDHSALAWLIDAYADGVTERRDVMRVTGMTASEYHNAHRRMLRLVERLSTHVREIAVTAMV